MNIVTTQPAAHEVTASFPTSSTDRIDRADAIFQAAGHLLPALEHGQMITTKQLRAAMTESFGGTDAQGFWVWKDAYEAVEVAQVLFLQKFGPAIVSHSASSHATLAMLTKIADLAPTHTRRSQESEALQQFSTPIPLGFAAARAAAITATDLVLEPSAGTGLLAVFASIAGARLVLNESGEIMTALSSSTRHTRWPMQRAAKVSAAMSPRRSRAGRACGCSMHCPMPASSMSRRRARPRWKTSPTRSGLASGAATIFRSPTGRSSFRQSRLAVWRRWRCLPAISRRWASMLLGCSPMTVSNTISCSMS